MDTGVFVAVIHLQAVRESCIGPGGKAGHGAGPAPQHGRFVAAEDLHLLHQLPADVAFPAAADDHGQNIQDPFPGDPDHLGRQFFVFQLGRERGQLFRYRL